MHIFKCFFALVESLHEFHVMWFHVLRNQNVCNVGLGLALIVWYFLRWTSTMFVSITDNSNKVGKIFLLICQSSAAISFTGILSPRLQICITISTITAHLNWQKDKFNFSKELLNNFIIWILTFSLSYLLDMQRPTKEEQRVDYWFDIHSVWIIKISRFIQFL